MKEVRNPAIVKAFRRIGLSDQAGTGIRAIFHNWHELGRFPPQVKNDVARKDFELVLLNKPLLTRTLPQFCLAVDAHLSQEQADVLALALSLPAGERLNLTSIRSLGISTTQRARAVADDLVLRQLLVPVSESLFELPEAVRQRLTEQVGTKSGSSWSQVGPEC
jgi:ATP-dependent DNA helicase RecG